MSLDKAIQHKKEHREPYRGSKSFDKACRNHGGCEWCLSNRMHKFKKSIKIIEPEEFNLINHKEKKK